MCMHMFFNIYLCIHIYIYKSRTSCTNAQHTVASREKTWIPRSFWTGSEGAFHLSSKMRISIFDALSFTVDLPSGYFVHGWKICSLRCSMDKALLLGYGHRKASVGKGFSQVSHLYLGNLSPPIVFVGL